jgi:hypothetical protein
VKMTLKTGSSPPEADQPLAERKREFLLTDLS